MNIQMGNFIINNKSEGLTRLGHFFWCVALQLFTIYNNKAAINTQPSSKANEKPSVPLIIM